MKSSKKQAEKPVVPEAAIIMDIVVYDGDLVHFIPFEHALKAQTKQPPKVRNAVDFQAYLGALKLGLA